VGALEEYRKMGMVNPSVVHSAIHSRVSRGRSVELSIVSLKV
jgi:hypothetical protein